MREHILNFDFASQEYKYFTTIDIKTLKDLTTSRIKMEETI